MSGGARIGERYVLGPALARGGMATVHLAKQLGAAGFRRLVAVKRLLPAVAADRDMADAFLAEAKVASCIRHANVVGIQDVVASGDELFLVMDYVSGASLGAVGAATKGPIPPDIAVAIACDVLEGLDAAHRARSEDGRPLDLVHRDVSPQNIMVGLDGVSRLIDFGIARSLARTQHTTEGVVKGKIRYLAPELLEGEAPTPASDIYAAGCVLWEALTGKALFEAESQAQLVTKVMLGDVDPPSRYAKGVPPALDDVVLAALRGSPGRRPKTAAELAAKIRGALTPAPARAVAEWLERAVGEQLAVRGDVVRAFEAEPIPDLTPDVRLPAPSVAPAETTPTTVAERPERRTFGWLVAAGAAIVVLGAIALRRPAPSAPPPEPSIAPSSVEPAPTPSTAPSASPLPSSEPSASSAAAALAVDAGPVPRTHASGMPSGARPHAGTPVVRDAGARPDCRIPYVIDADGTRIYKRECLE